MANDTYLPGMGGPAGVKRPEISQNSQNSLENLGAEELWALRQRIDEILPPGKLKDLDLAHELVLQLKIAQKLQEETLADMDTPANQKSQVLNAVAGAIQAISKLQVELYDSERLKRIEACLIETVGILDPADQEAFFERYERALERV